MLTADPYALRRLADQCLAASAHMQSRSNRMLATVQSTVEGPSGWRGAGAQNYEKRGELLFHEIRKASTTLSEMTPALQALAYRVEQIQYKKQELQRVESHLSSLHMSMNLKDDAEIAYLEGRAAVLRMEIDSESAYADMSAAAAFRAIEISAVLTTELEALCKATSAVGKEIEHVAEVAWDDYIKPTAKAVWNGIEEFLDIPEMEAAWKDLMDPSKSWQDRLLAAGTLVVDGALDVSTLFGVGDAIKGAKFLVKFGWKYGKKIIEVEGRKQMAAVIKKHLNQFAENVRNGVEKLFGRGRPLGDRLGFAGGGAGRAAGFSMEKNGQVYRFSEGVDDAAKAKLETPASNTGRELTADEHIKLDNWKHRPSDEKYLKYKDVYDDSKYYNQETGDINWPPNDGVEGETTKMMLEEGTLLDRYGEPSGKFFSPAGIPYEQRALALHSDEANYYVYKVLTPFEVDGGKIAPWFGREGGGLQFVKYHPNGKMYTLQELIDEDYIEEVLVKKGGVK